MIWSFPLIKKKPQTQPNKTRTKKNKGKKCAILPCYHQHWHFRSQLCWTWCSKTLLCLKVVVLKANFTLVAPLMHFTSHGQSRGALSLSTSMARLLYVWTDVHHPVLCYTDAFRLQFNSTEISGLKNKTFLKCIICS